jgi:outer membrane receptor for monomeric catechols
MKTAAIALAWALLAALSAENAALAREGAALPRESGSAAATASTASKANAAGTDGTAGTAAAADPADSAGDPTASASPPVLRHREELVVRDSADLVAPVPAVTRLALPSLLLPVSVEVIGPRLLEQQDARVLGDALKNASGVGVHTESGAADFFVVRGLDSESSALVMTDGAPEPVTTFYQLYNVDRVEVL